MAVNKVTLGDETLIDLTNDTAEPEDVLEGAYFHTAAGVRTAGTRRNVVVDDELSPTSENPVQNKVIYEALQNIHIDVDDELSASSENPVQNKVVTLALNQKAGILRDTASGGIASFVPDATIDNLLGVTVDVEPVQDLHGYDSPWPAGGGKNLLQVTATTQTINGVTFAVNDDGTVLVNGTATTNAVFILNSYDFDGTAVILNGCPSGGSGSTFKLDAFGASGLSEDIGSGVTISTSGARNIRIVVFSGVTITNKLFTPMIRLASVTDNTFAPYENLCPISGWDAVGIERAGVNLFDKANGAKNLYVGAENKTGSGGTMLCFCAKKGTKYTISMTGGNRTNLYYYDTTSLGDIVAGITLTTVTLSAAKPYTFTADHDAVYCYYADTSYQQSIVDTCMVALTTDSAYEPYQGNTYAITLGQTVYGGTLDVTNGTMTVEWACVTESSGAGWTLDSAERAYKVFDIRNHDSNLTPSPYVKTNYLKTISFSDGYSFKRQGVFIGQSSKNVCVHIDGVTDVGVSAFNAYLSEHPLQICYTLATPIEITLTPTQIATLVGQNNVWSDAGDVSVEFAADLKHYIDSKIAAAVAALS